MDLVQQYLRVMIICDDPDTGSVWRHLLQRKGIDTVLIGTSASQSKEKNDSDLVIIDETDSKIEGIKIIQAIKPDIAGPILLLTTNNNEAYIIKAYQAGVDECIPKPISPALFLYRVRALLRNARTIPITGLDKVETTSINLDPVHRTVMKNDGKEIKLSQLEFRLMHLLMKNPGWVFHPDQIIPVVWGYSEVGDNRLLKHLIFRLRQKIEENPRKPKLIITEPGVGYKFDPEVVA